MLDVFLESIRVFMAAHNMPPTRFGVLAVGDGGFLKSIQDGRSPSLATVDRVQAFMDAYDRDAVSAASLAVAASARRPRIGAIA